MPHNQLSALAYRRELAIAEENQDRRQFANLNIPGRLGRQNCRLV